MTSENPTPEEANTPPAEPETAPEPEPTPLISFDDFLNVHLRVGKVVEAEKVPKTRKLLKLQVDLAEDDGPRTLIAGIAESYTEEELIGKHIIVVANLQPAKIRKVLSQGMLLACDTPEGVRIVEPPALAPIGSRLS